MKLKEALGIVSTVHGGVLGFGTLWVNGYLDKLPDATKTIERAVARQKKPKTKKAKERKR